MWELLFRDRKSEKSAERRPYVLFGDVDFQEIIGSSPEVGSNSFIMIFVYFDTAFKIPDFSSIAINPGMYIAACPLLSI